MRSFPWVLAALGSLAAPQVPASFDQWVESALAEPILAKDQTLAETQSFCESRVPSMPELSTADGWRTWATTAREQVFRDVLFRGEATVWRNAGSKLEWRQTFRDGPDYRNRGLVLEAVPGLWIPGLLYEPTRMVGKVPVVLNVNGHDAKGKAVPYKQIRCINLAKRGILALNLEWFGMGQLQGPGYRHDRINAIDLCGTSGVAVHYLALRNALDHLLAHAHADSSRVAVTGLSGGGWQTAFFSPLEERVTLANPVAGYSSFRTRARVFSDLGDSEQTPSDLATVVDYTHLTAMMAPRPLLLTFNANDNCCFASGHALPPLLDNATPVYQLFGKREFLRSHTNDVPGDHNYGLDNRQAFYRMLADFWSESGDAPYTVEEIRCDAELLTPEQLQIPLPEPKLDLGKLAARLAEGLPRVRQESPDAARRRLRGLVRPYDLAATAESTQTRSSEGVTSRNWRLHVGESWTVPGVEFTPVSPKTRRLILADGGRVAAKQRVLEHLSRGEQVLVLDTFSLGECGFAHHGYLFALLVATIGERPLGLQVGQVLAAARWLANREQQGAVTVEAIGPRSSVIATVAAALDPEAIAALELHHSLDSLHRVIDDGREYAASPELFCFGLLEAFDIPQLRRLIEPRPIRELVP